MLHFNAIADWKTMRIFKVILEGWCLVHNYSSLLLLENGRSEFIADLIQTYFNSIQAAARATASYITVSAMFVWNKLHELTTLENIC